MNDLEVQLFTTYLKILFYLSIKIRLNTLTTNDGFTIVFSVIPSNKLQKAV